MTTAALRESATFRGKRVSRAWRIILDAAARAGVRFTLNQGRRTMSEQAAFYAAYLRGGTLAARPSSGAPHIKAGRANHALDIRWDDGGARRLASWLARNGVRVAFNVPTEAWHMDPVDEGQLLAAARRLDDPLAGYPADERRWIHEYDNLVRADRDRDRRRVLRRVMIERRKSIWRAAQDSGWDRLRRSERYRSLKARTTTEEG